MFNPGQIVWDAKIKSPINSDNIDYSKNYSHQRIRHFIDAEGKPVCPKNIEHAKLLLKRNRIVPSPIPEHWCWSCNKRTWNIPDKSCEVPDEHTKCGECNSFSDGLWGTYRKKLVCEQCKNKLDKNLLKELTEELSKEVSLIKIKYDFHYNKVAELADEIKKATK